MTERTWRNLAVAMLVVLVLLVGAVTAMWLGGPGDGDGATPTATAPGGSATATSEPTSGPSGSVPSPSPCCSEVPSASPSGSGSPGPSASPAVPVASVVLRGLGLDDPAGPQARQRVIVLASDGPGDMTVKLLSATGGKVAFCLVPGTLAKPLGEPACLKSGTGTLTGHSRTAKSFTWTITLIGAADGTTPAADLRITWRSNAPRLEIIDFRLQGVGSEPFNGVNMELGARPAAGRLTLAASWSDPVGGDTHPFEATIVDAATGLTLDAAAGDGPAVELIADLGAQQRTTVTLRDPEPLVATEVIGHLTLTWP